MKGSASAGADAEFTGRDTDSIRHQGEHADCRDHAAVLVVAWR